METARRVDRFLVFLLAVSLLVNVAVVWRFANRRVNTAAVAGPDVQVGATLDPLVGVSEDGRPMTVSYDGDARPVVLYVFSPTCVWCERNVENIGTLAKSASSGFRFVGVSLSAPTETPQGTVDFPVIFSDGRVPFRSTPQTVVVGPNGRVLRSWTGAYSGSSKSEIEDYFAVRLPGLQTKRKGGQS